MGLSTDRSDKEKKDKKEKKAKRAEAGGITKVKSDKKEKKAKKDKLASAVQEHVDAEAEKTKDSKEKKHKKAKSAEDEEAKPTLTDAEFEAVSELVPFAFPKATDKAAKKVFKAVKLGAKVNQIFRGLKEVDKNIKKYGKERKIEFSEPQKFNGIAVIAADIAPHELVLHIPAYCEENGIEYIFVNSRVALGEAANTQRSTSVVLLVPEILKTEAQKAKGASKEVSEEDLAKFKEVFNEVSAAAKASFDEEISPWIRGVHPLQISNSTIAV